MGRITKDDRCLIKVDYEQWKNGGKTPNKKSFRMVCGKYESFD